MLFQNINVLSFIIHVNRVLSRSREIKVGKYDKSSDVAEQNRLQSIQKARVIQWLCFTPPSTINDAKTVNAKLLRRALMHRYLSFILFSVIKSFSVHENGNVIARERASVGLYIV